MIEELAHGVQAGRSSKQILALFQDFVAQQAAAKGSTDAGDDMLLNSILGELYLLTKEQDQMRTSVNDGISGREKSLRARINDLN